MAALTDAMRWYSLGGLKAARLKYFFIVEFYSSQYTQQLGGASTPGRLIFDSVRTVELPKFSIETEVVNAWNVRQVVPTKINFEPISITFNDTLDNRFQKFIKNYMNIVSGSFQKLDKSMRLQFDSFGIKSLPANADCPLDKVVITRFYGDNGGNLTSGSRNNGTNEGLMNKSIVTLWRPKIVDVQHDTLDYSSSEAINWQISLRYESITYEDDKEEQVGGSARSQSSQQGAGTSAQDDRLAAIAQNALRKSNVVTPPGQELATPPIVPRNLSNPDRPFNLTSNPFKGNGG